MITLSTLGILSIRYLSDLYRFTVPSVFDIVCSLYKLGLYGYWIINISHYHNIFSDIIIHYIHCIWATLIYIYEIGLWVFRCYGWSQINCWANDDICLPVCQLASLPVKSFYSIEIVWQTYVTLLNHKEQSQLIQIVPNRLMQVGVYVLVWIYLYLGIGVGKTCNSYMEIPDSVWDHLKAKRNQYETL